MQMFSFLFKPKKECFICYSTGKTEKEELYDIIYFNKTMNYPLISMDKTEPAVPAANLPKVLEERAYRTSPFVYVPPKPVPPY